jgi:hypothetical protein
METKWHCTLPTPTPYPTPPLPSPSLPLPYRYPTPPLPLPFPPHPYPPHARHTPATRSQLSLPLPFSSPPLLAVSAQLRQKTFWRMKSSGTRLRAKPSGG